MNRRATHRRHVAVLACLALALFTLAASATAQRRPALCDPHATRVEASVLEVSRYAMCGGFGLTEVVIRVRVDRRISGPKTPRIVLAVIPCPGSNLDVVPHLEMCLGQQPPEWEHHRFDDFESDPAPRRVARVLREY